MIAAADGSAGRQNPVAMLNRISNKLINKIINFVSSWFFIGDMKKLSYEIIKIMKQKRHTKSIYSFVG